MDEILAQKDGATTRYLVQDGLGSTTETLNSSAVIQQRYVYDAFGKVEVQNSSGIPIPDAPLTNYLYTGRELQQESGLYNYRNRFYHPGVGRFLQPDPIGFEGGDVNIYSYVRNQPVNRIDPLGLCDWGQIGAAFQVKAGGGLGLQAHAQLGGLSGKAGAAYSFGGWQNFGNSSTRAIGNFASVTLGGQLSLGNHSLKAGSFYDLKTTSYADLDCPGKFEEKTDPFKIGYSYNGLSGQNWTTISFSATAGFVSFGASVNFSQVWQGLSAP